MTSTLKVPKSAGSGGVRGALAGPWILPIVQGIVATRQIAWSLVPGAEVQVLNSSAVQHGYENLTNLRTAMDAATQGTPYKDIQSGGLAAAFSNCPAAAAAGSQTNINVAGWRIRVSASQLNFNYQPIYITIGRITNTAGVFSVSAANTVLRLAVISSKPLVDVFVISPTNAAGLMTIVPGTQNEVVTAGNTTTGRGVLVSAVDANHIASIETINSYDWISRRTSLPAANDMRDFDRVLGVDWDMR